MSDTEGSSGGGSAPAAQPAAEQPSGGQPAAGPPAAATESASKRPRRTSRREFLIGGATATAAAVGAAYVTRELRDQKLPAVSSSRVRRAAVVRPTVKVASKPKRADWAALRRHLSTHRLLRPRETGYDQARHLFEPRFDSLEPAAIAYCRTATDVATCLSFVRKFELAVRVRSGGHSYAGWSSVTGGLIIDVSPMTSVRFDGQTVTVGAGLDLIHFYASLGARGVAVPGGTCPTIGIAGLALGGGIGRLTRLLGTTSDNVTAMELVTADGRELTCDATQNQDLFWACRGGGGGNFGVTTSLTFGTTPLRELCVFASSWPWSRAARVIRGWQSWAPHAPDPLSSTVQLSAPFGGSPSLTVTGTFAGPSHRAAKLLDALYAQIGSGPTASSVEQETYLSAMLAEADCSAVPLAACHAGPGGQVARVPSFAKSDFFTRPLRAHAIRLLLSGMEDVAGIMGAVGGVASVTLEACGGAMNTPSPSATAFVHRDALFLAQYSTTWTSPGKRSDVIRQHTWLRAYYQSLHPHASGQAYQNYVDPDLADWPTAYYGANYPWLILAKASVDPANVFRFPQSIPPSWHLAGGSPA
jgi:FAD binding domain/Berberine and berberine like